MKASILISSYKRVELFRRTLWSIANRGPSVPFEVVVADESEGEAADQILEELKSYSSVFPWTLVRFSSKKFEEQTGVRKFWNNPAATNNIAFAHSDPESALIFQQGNEVIAWDGVYDALIEEAERAPSDFLVVSTTYDVRQQILDQLDSYGANLSQHAVDSCRPWPLQSKAYRSDVTNYLALWSRKTWEKVGGYDERFLLGIGGEDSDIVRRARTIPGFELIVSDGVSLHQNHNGFHIYQDAPPSVITKEKRAEGESIKWEIYNSWDGQTKPGHSWETGCHGVTEIL